MNIDVTLYATAYRPENWMEVYEGIGKNELNWDMIFVGPNPPVCEMPDNFKFIQTLVKPAQCVEIAARAAVGELIMNLTDDVLFRTPHPLDKLCQEYREQNSKKIMVTPRFMLHGVDCMVEYAPSDPHRYWCDDPTSPRLGICCLMSRRKYMELGGVDRKFIAVNWDHDIQMRLQAEGGELIVSRDVYLDEVASLDKRPGSTGAAHYCPHDRQGLLDVMWTIPGTRTCTFERSLPFEPFSDERILEESQGPKGHWI